MSKDPKSKIMKISIALVGAGYWGQKLLPKFIGAPDCSVKTVCDLSAALRDNAKQKFPAVVTTDSFDAVLKDSAIDAVLLVTPPATHFPLAQKALEAGKHVWIEKPLALQVDEGRRLVGLAEAKKAVLFVDHTFLYDPAIRMARELIQKGELGEIYHLFLQRLNLGRIKRDSNVWWNSAPHDASILLHLLPGRPVAIRLQGYRYLQREVEDLNMATIDMSDGSSAFIHHNWLSPENTAKLTVIGSKKLLTYEGRFDKRALTVYEYATDLQATAEPTGDDLANTIPSKITAERKLEIDREEPLAAAVTDFLDSIRRRHAPISDGGFSLRVLALLEAGEKSLRAGGEKIAVEL
jgi:predicted dehydrogenase